MYPSDAHLDILKPFRFNFLTLAIIWKSTADMLATGTLVVLLLALWSGLALAQTGPQNASIPNCVRACDTQAIKASNCTSEDQYCHCIRYTTILDSIVPCVQHNSTCSNATADLLSMRHRSLMTPILADYSSFRDIVRRRLSEVQLVCSDECDRKLDFSPKAFAVALHKSSFD